MSTPNLQPIRGFRDLYPKDKALQNYIFEKLRAVATVAGYEEYDGPLLEPIEIYLQKTSEELVKQQSYNLKDKKDQTLLLRPEMTPTLARMIAARAGELTFPMRLFNLGQRFRYEAPQKGRAREFYQGDFDILGTESILADAATLNTVITVFRVLGASEKDFVVSINSRKFLQGVLSDAGLTDEQIKQTLIAIDHKDKISEETFEIELQNIGLSEKATATVRKILKNDVAAAQNKYFRELFAILKGLGIEKFCKINTGVVRGLDYYTGLVFEVWEQGPLKRALLGGGRYDNLVSDFNPKVKIPGVGFAVSDVVLEEFLKDKNLLPQLSTKTTHVLVTVFNEETVLDAIAVFNELRKAQIPSELYLGIDVKLDKQLKYADGNNIPYIVIIGPEEIQKKVVKLKDMNKKEQKEFALEELIKFLRSN